MGARTPDARMPMNPSTNAAGCAATERFRRPCWPRILRLALACALVPAVALQGCGVLPERGAAPQLEVGVHGPDPAATQETVDWSAPEAAEVVAAIAIGVLLFVVLPRALAKDVVKSLRMPSP